MRIFPSNPPKSGLDVVGAPAPAVEPSPSVVPKAAMPAPQVIPEPDAEPAKVNDTAARERLEKESQALDAAIASELSGRIDALKQTLGELMERIPSTASQAAATPVSVESEKVSEVVELFQKKMEALESSMAKDRAAWSEALQKRDEALHEVQQTIVKTQERLEQHPSTPVVTAETPVAVLPFVQPETPVDPLTSPEPSEATSDPVEPPISELDKAEDAATEDSASDLALDWSPAPQQGWLSRIKAYLNGTVVEIPTHRRRH